MCQGAGDALVVVDYSTSWCGPCKIIAPKYDEMSEKYKNVKFFKVCALSAPSPSTLATASPRNVVVTRAPAPAPAPALLPPRRRPRTRTMPPLHR